MISSPQIGEPKPGAVISASKTTLAYRALLCFSFLYFIRPEDFIPGLIHIPLGKIAGASA